jgi:uncharacterized protein (TIGR00266 family)
VKHNILYRPSFAVARVELEDGEKIRTESGAMVGMSANISLDAKMEGGFLKSLARAAAGESLFQSTFTAKGGQGEVLLAPSTPGDIMGIELNNQSFLIQSGAWLASSPDIKIETKFNGGAMLGGGGALLIKVTGTGLTLLASYGAIHKIVLDAGETYIIDTGHIVAFESTVSFKIDKAAKGFMASATSGEGLVCRYTGPGEVYIQTRNIQAFAQSLLPFLPKPTAG